MYFRTYDELISHIESRETKTRKDVLHFIEYSNFSSLLSSYDDYSFDFDEYKDCNATLSWFTKTTEYSIVSKILFFRPKHLSLKRLFHVFSSGFHIEVQYPVMDLDKNLEDVRLVLDKGVEYLSKFPKTVI